MRAFAFALALALVGCPQHPKAPPPAPKEPAPEIVSCTIRGSQRLYPTTYIHPTSRGGTVLARSGGDVVGFELSDLSVGAMTRASVRAPVNGPAFVVTGFLELRELDVYANRDLPIVPGHVWIEKGANVRLVRGGDGKKARVASSYGAFDETAALTACDALTLDPSIETEVPRAPRNASSDRLAHVITNKVDLRDEDGRLLTTLQEGSGATLEITARRGDLVHVLYNDGLAIDGWMSARDLEPGDGPDCDDCHGSIRDIYDKCPDVPTDDDEDGCPALDTIVHASAVRDTDIRIGPEPTSLVIGRLERRAEVIIPTPRKDAPSGVVRVRPRHGELEPFGGDFWVDESALQRE
jgi:hypothetical protein